jgi:hypothetical protein
VFDFFFFFFFFKMEAIVLSNVNIITYLLDDMMNSLQHHKITKSNVLVSFTKNHGKEK